jgi:hypothetical protein
MLIVEVIEHAVVISAFVFVMMVTVEYLNVVTRGAWQERLRAYGKRQHLLAGCLGAVPGCLGAFTNVVLYEHRIITVGAVVAGMIATSGDAVFIMIATVPLPRVLLLTTILLATGVTAGFIYDKLFGRTFVELDPACEKLELHENESFGWAPDAGIWDEWRSLSMQRGVMVGGLALFIFFMATGHAAADEETWLRITLLLVAVVGLYIVATVPEHFLEEHLWDHVVKRHLPAVFLWTLGALFLVKFLGVYAPETSWPTGRMWILVIAACVAGLIPDSGPHMVFVTMYAEGMIPFSVLLANAIVQDGHGMLPLLACSRRDFVRVKAANFVVGLIVGFGAYWLKM